HIHLLPPTSTLSLLQQPSPPDIYTLSLHDALPICSLSAEKCWCGSLARRKRIPPRWSASPCRIRASESPAMRFPSFSTPSPRPTDRKSTRLNSSHLGISYAVFCLKKKKKKNTYVDV